MLVDVMNIPKHRVGYVNITNKYSNDINTNIETFSYLMFSIYYKVKKR